MLYNKPSGGYTISSTEGTNNIFAIYDYLAPLGYTKTAVAGMLGNVMKESGLNPWRWEGNTVNYNKGYGLFQFTPASGYINNCSDVSGYGPNLSTSQQTSGASQDDGYAQLYVFDTDRLGKWYSGLWRSYWDTSQNPWTYTMYQNMILDYGNTISMSEFRTMDILTYATLAFLGCYEGPADKSTAHPEYQTIDENFDDRYNYAQQIYQLLEPYGGRDNLLVTLKILDTQHKRKFNNI